MTPAKRVKVYHIVMLADVVQFGGGGSLDFPTIFS
jgi:hypothetical protein